MRTLVIGDIHGCLTALDAVLAFSGVSAADTLILLGDYIDRGPDPAGVIKRIINLRKTHSVLPLLGNHEQMLLGARFNMLLNHEWVANGGDTTLHSYGGRYGSLRDIPAEHWMFLQSLALYHETSTHIFVHAGVDPALPMASQPEYALLWERFHEPPPRHISGKIVVCGHTPGRTVRFSSRAICLDTGAFRSDGLLTCLDVGSGRLYQANQRGQTRMGHLGEASSEK